MSVRTSQKSSERKGRLGKAALLPPPHHKDNHPPMTPSKNPKANSCRPKNNSPKPSVKNDCNKRYLHIRKLLGRLPAPPPLSAPFIFASPTPLPLRSPIILRFSDDDLLFALSVWLFSSAGLRLSMMEAGGLVTVGMALDAGAMLRQAQKCQQGDLERLIWSADLRDERCRRMMAESWASPRCLELMRCWKQGTAEPSFFGGCVRDVWEFGLWIAVAVRGGAGWASATFLPRWEALSQVPPSLGGGT